MSRKTKYICDRCKKEFDIDDINSTDVELVLDMADNLFVSFTEYGIAEKDFCCVQCACEWINKFASEIVSEQMSEE